MPLRLFLAFFPALLVAFVVAQAQTPATGAVTITGAEQGPIYPCGNTSCPTYDSGQITITVSGFNAVTNYSRNGGQKTSQQLANALAAKLNSATSSVKTGVAGKKKNPHTKIVRGSLDYSLRSTRTSHS